MVESLSSDGIGLDRSSTDVVTLEVGQNIMLTGNNVEVLNAHRSSNSPDVVLWATSSGEQVFQTSNGTAGSSPTTPSTPLNTPLSSAAVTSQSTAQSGLRGAQARQPYTPPGRSAALAKSSGPQSLWISQPRTEFKYSGTKLRANQVCYFSGHLVFTKHKRQIHNYWILLFGRRIMWTLKKQQVLETALQIFISIKFLSHFSTKLAFCETVFVFVLVRTALCHKCGQEHLNWRCKMLRMFQ